MLVLVWRVKEDIRYVWGKEFIFRGLVDLVKVGGIWTRFNRWI